jgi:hypothetical protein
MDWLAGQSLLPPPVGQDGSWSLLPCRCGWGPPSTRPLAHSLCGQRAGVATLLAEARHSFTRPRSGQRLRPRIRRITWIGWLVSLPSRSGQPWSHPRWLLPRLGLSSSDDTAARRRAQAEGLLGTLEITEEGRPPGGPERSGPRMSHTARPAYSA